MSYRTTEREVDCGPIALSNLAYHLRREVIEPHNFDESVGYTPEKGSLKFVEYAAAQGWRKYDTPIAAFDDGCEAAILLTRTDTADRHYSLCIGYSQFGYLLLNWKRYHTYWATRSRVNDLIVTCWGVRPSKEQ